MADDLNFQQISSVQNGLQPKPTRLTAAATIAPNTFLTILVGATAVQTITPPVTGCHMLTFVAGGVTGFTTGGNVSGGTTTVSGRAYVFVYDPVSNTYYLVSSTTS